MSSLFHLFCCYFIFYCLNKSAKYEKLRIYCSCCTQNCEITIAYVNNFRQKRLQSFENCLIFIVSIVLLYVRYKAELDLEHIPTSALEIYVTKPINPKGYILDIGRGPRYTLDGCYHIFQKTSRTIKSSKSAKFIFDNVAQYQQ